MFIVKVLTQNIAYTLDREFFYLSNDKVEIVVDKINDKLKNNAELKWFAYVNTELAKKILIKYFENK